MRYAHKYSADYCSEFLRPYKVEYSPIESLEDHNPGRQKTSALLFHCEGVFGSQFCQNLSIHLLSVTLLPLVDLTKKKFSQGSTK